MTHSTPKPLPETPSSLIFRRLTIDSNAHISELIQRVVHEEELDNSWADAIKSALANFGEYVTMAQILPGLKSVRQAQDHASIRADAVARECRRKERDGMKELKTGKGKGNDKIPEKETMEVEALNLPKKDVFLKEIQALTSRVALPAPTTTPKHLFLTAAPPSITPEQDADFDIVPESRPCSFRSEVYSFPFYNDAQGKHGQGGVVVCGLDNWKPDDSETTPRIVGGTFTFRNLANMTTYESLIIVLKLSIYTYMSLILEQHLLSNLHVTLEYPTPPPSFISPLQSYPTSPDDDPPRKLRSAKPPSGIWSFLSRKTEGIIHRVAGGHLGNADDTVPRTTSLDLGTPLPSPFWRTQRISEESTRIDSVMAQTEHSSNSTKEEDRQNRERYGPFTSAIRHILDQHCILSASPKLAYPPSQLITRLAQREEEQKKDGDGSSSIGSSLRSSTSSTLAVATSNSLPGPPSLKLTGVEKTGLGSVLGWEGRDTKGSGVVGIRNFVRHQGLTVLYAEQTASGAETHPCGRPRLVTFRYWTRASAVDAERDQSLGHVVERACDEGEAGERCETEGCDKPRGKHCMSWACCGVKVGARMEESSDATRNVDGIEMWQTCSLCGKTTDRTKMDDGTYLFSFAKFLELLIWSPYLTSLAQCDHNASVLSSSLAAPISSSRFHILRHFAHKRRILTFTLSSIQNDIYEFRFPKLQLISGSIPKEPKVLSETRKKREDEEDRLVLEKEIDDWWHGVKAWLDKLARFLEEEAVQALESKDLPPLPASEDEASDDETTSRPNPPRRRPQMTRLISFQQSLTPPRPEAIGRKPAAPYPPVLPSSIRESRKLLTELRTSFQKTEDTLRKQAQETPFSTLNDARQSFRGTSRGVAKRLIAWQKKHAPGAPAEILAGGTLITEPEWWSGSCHTVPGGHVVVREGEWGSLIAFTLSSLDYQRELASLHMTSGSSSSHTSPNSALPDPLLTSPNATIKPIKAFIQNPDPDDNDTTTWEELELCTAVITRREHPREVSSLLSLRDVLRTKHSFDSSSISSRFSRSVSRGVANFTPPAAWAQPQVKVNLEAADGHVSQFPEAADMIEKVLESQYPAHHQVEITVDSDKLSDVGEATPTPSSFVERHIRTGGASTFMPFDHSPETQSSGTQHVPLVAPKPQVASAPIPVPGSGGEPETPPTSSSFTSALFTNAMRYFLNPGPPSRAPSPTPSGTHHGLLAFDAASSIDDRPHIKYDWTIGKRLKFSCTVYYAKQFDALRKRCGVDEVVIKSLERSENWTAVGGKSKSNFWKSADNRFIIKTLVNAWNVADLQVLIELAPSYFRHIDSTANKASVLAKLMGFYTIEIKNLETGSVQAKHDLLVMENLFYNQKVTKTFDLKGIQSRRVKVNTDVGDRRTLFDGEWIDAQRRAPLYIQPHSGHILQEAIKSDAEFLAKSNIMDYSLLLGIDQEAHEIACGLVDTIGSYTFAKTLEYKAKHNLNSGKGKEVTVIPPTEYHTRFVNSMDSYFIICPDKWTKPPHFIDRTKVDDLPSVV